MAKNYSVEGEKKLNYFPNKKKQVYESSAAVNERFDESSKARINHELHLKANPHLQKRRKYHKGGNKLALEKPMTLTDDESSEISMPTPIQKPELEKVIEEMKQEEKGYNKEMETKATKRRMPSFNKSTNLSSKRVKVTEKSDLPVGDFNLSTKKELEEFTRWMKLQS